MQDHTASGKPTLAFFYSPTSGPSRKVEAFLAQVLQRRRNHDTFALRRINCDDRPDLVTRFAVTTVPTLVVVEGRRVRARLEGSAGCRDIERLLEPWLKRRTAVPATSDAVDDDPIAETSSIYDRRGLHLPGELSFDRWQAVGRKIGVVADGSLWWLADWAAYGEDAYGDDYRAAVAVTGFEPRTLHHYAWIARRFPADRRREQLSFAHHAEVASLAEAEQGEWLDRAERRGWSRTELRAELRRELRAREVDADPAEVLQLNVGASQLAHWRAAAEAESLDLAEWLSSVADEAARPAGSSVRAA
jgi:hypothetical protein